MALNVTKMVRYASLGAELTSPPIVGAVVGYYLDDYLKTSPYLTMALLLAGVAVSFYRLILLTTSLRNGRD